jgi:predicted amino acid dehydrogenase
MSDGQYHFQDIHSVSCTEDGQHLLLNVTGAAGVCGITIPEKIVGRVCMYLLEMSAEARRRSKEKTIQSSKIREIMVMKHHDPEQAILAITIHTGAAPIAFDLDEKQLVEFARGILETRGLLPVQTPERRQ